VCSSDLVLRTDLGPVSLLEVAIFIGVVLLGLVHALRRGLLRWT
jgi:NADH-quinone oxidoreductase subunit A